MKHNNITFCLKVPYFTTNAVLHTHPLKFFNLVIVHTLDFWYMIKNKEATDSAALEFCHILNKFAAQLDECLSFKDFGLRQNSRASFRRKLGESAICSKYEQNSTASLSVAYLFFIIYSKSTVGQLQKFKFLIKNEFKITSNILVIDY